MTVTPNSRHLSDSLRVSKSCFPPSMRYCCTSPGQSRETQVAYVDFTLFPSLRQAVAEFSPDPKPRYFMSIAVSHGVLASGPREIAANGRYFEAKYSEAQMPSPQFQDLNIQCSVIGPKRSLGGNGILQPGLGLRRGLRLSKDRTRPTCQAGPSSSDVPQSSHFSQNRVCPISKLIPS